MPRPRGDTFLRPGSTVKIQRHYRMDGAPAGEIVIPPAAGAVASPWLALFSPGQHMI